MTAVFAALLTLLPAGAAAADADSSAVHYRLDGRQTTQKKLTSAISTVDVDRISKYPDLNLTNTLQGQAAGLVVRSNAGALGTGSTINIRGPHAFNANTAIVVIDGIESSMDNLIPEQIETIEILKDAPAKLLYGPAAANGVVLITTRRGKISEPVINVTAEYGITPAHFMADYLDSYSYATLYNEARANDGMTPFYLPYQLQGYQNTTGANDLLYPDVDIRKETVGNRGTYLNAAFDFNGGNSKVLYALSGGYKSGSGIEKIGKTSKYDLLNLRANLDIPVADFITVKADAGADVKLVNRGVVAINDVFSKISTHRPNEYALTIDPDAIGVQENTDGTPIFGGSTDNADNLYADMKYGGNFSQRYITSHVSLSVDFDLDRWVKGLSVYGQVAMDNYNFLAQQLKNTYPTYSVRTYLDGAGEVQQNVTELRKLDLPKSNSITNTQHTRTMAYVANVTYARSFGKHNLSAVLAGRYMSKENKGTSYDRLQGVYSLRLNYDWDGKYLVEGVVAAMRANKFPADSKYFVSPAVSLGWLVSEEDFLKNSSVVNYLKIKASAGLQGYGVNTDFDLYRTTWNQSGSIKFGEKNTTTKYLVSLVRLGNEKLKWESVLEYNAGAEWGLFGNRLYGEGNFFYEQHRNIIGTDGTVRSGELGDYVVAANIGQTSKIGTDIALGWRETRGDFSYDLSLNFLYTKDKVEKADELANIEEYRKSVGKSSTAMFGLQSLGLFGKDVSLANAPVQTFGPYQEGDIAYKDQNGDGIVDGSDVIQIGRSFPSSVWSLCADLKYKGFGLYMLATAELGAGFRVPEAYYWNNAESKYSTLASDRYHPVNNPDGIYPRLTTTSGENNYRNTDFWYRSSDFLRLKNVELSYTFKLDKKKCHMSAIRLFVRGTNLAVLSPVKDLDPECPTAGITISPYYSTYTGGFKVTF